jgi:hypothetical protein
MDLNEATLGATDQGTEVGTADQGTEPGATSTTTSCHAGSAASHLGAKIHDAEMCYLGAASHDAELRVHFPNSFQQGSNCELLSQKGPKSKKVGGERAHNGGPEGEHAFAGGRTGLLVGPTQRVRSFVPESGANVWLPRNLSTPCPQSPWIIWSRFKVYYEY